MQHGLQSYSGLEDSSLEWYWYCKCTLYFSLLTEMSSHIVKRRTYKQSSQMSLAKHIFALLLERASDSHVSAFHSTRFVNILSGDVVFLSASLAIYQRRIAKII